MNKKKLSAQSTERKVSPQATEGRKIAKRRNKLRKQYGVKLDISQGTVAEWIGVSQRQYSYFEEGRATLSVDQITELKNYLSLAEAGDLASLPNPKLRLLEESQFLDLQQRYLNRGRFKELWLFGPKSLPVLTEANYQRVWAANLRSGRNYNLVWVIDEPEHPRHLLLQATLSAVLQEVGKTENAGRIKIYPVSILPPAQSLGYGAYNRIKAHLKAHFEEQCDVYSAESIAENEFSDSRPILFYGWGRSVVCFLDETGANTFAAVFMEDVSNNPKKSETGWTFLSPDARSELEALIGNFTKGFEKRLKLKSTK